MNLNFAFKHMTASDAIRTFTTEKCERLERYFQGNLSVSWNFSVDKLVQAAHCHVVGNNIDFFGEGHTEDLRTSIDEALEHVEKQIKKHKDIVTHHHCKDGELAKAD